MLTADIAALSHQLRDEATDLIRRSNLRETLAQPGEAVIVGSYALDLMTWRDIDCHVLMPGLDPAKCFALAHTLADHLKPRKMHFRDERPGDSPGLPIGLYWGLLDVPGSGGHWKVDVWLVEAQEFGRMNRYHKTLEDRLDPQSRAAILRIKSECCSHPLYRRDFYSTDIYTAVLDHGVTSLAAFRAHLRQTRNLSI